MGNGFKRSWSIDLTLRKLLFIENFFLRAIQNRATIELRKNRAGRKER